MEMTKAQKAYRELLKAICTRRDELLKRNAGVTAAVADMRSRLDELEARRDETTDIEEALKLADECAVIKRHIEGVAKVKGVDVEAELKAFAYSKENTAIYAAAEAEHQDALERWHEDRRKWEAEREAQRLKFRDCPYAQTHDAIDNILNYGGWRVAGWNGGLFKE